VTGFRTRGQPAATRALEAMIAAGPPHALLIVGPSSAGKTTLALDLAAALLCDAPDPAVRPDRTCRGCRLVDAGNHPDLHRLAPEGAGGQITIGQVRGLIGELALLPVEGGARVAILEAADRLNEDAQNGLLKTLEEPPDGLTIVLCADEEDRLLPTVQSRVARLRLGVLGTRDIEALLGERGEADAALAARLARFAAGRPGRAIAYARFPEAVTIRGELTRGLLDLLDAGSARRLTAGRELLTRAGDLASGLIAATGRTRAAEAAPRRKGGLKAGAVGGSARTGPAGPTGATAPFAVTGADAYAPDVPASDGEPPGDDAVATGRNSPAERRRNALALLEVWRDLARDLMLVSLGDAREIREPDLLEELRAHAARTSPATLAGFLARLDRAAELLDGNANPELTVDVLVLAWPRSAGSAPAARHQSVGNRFVAGAVG